MAGVLAELGESITQGVETFGDGLIKEGKKFIEHPVDQLEALKTEAENEIKSIVGNTKQIGTVASNILSEGKGIATDILTGAEGAKDVAGGVYNRSSVQVSKGFSEISGAANDIVFRAKRIIPNSNLDPTKPENQVRQAPTMVDRLIPVKYQYHDAQVPGKEEYKRPPIIQTKPKQIPVVRYEVINTGERSPFNLNHSQVNVNRTIGRHVPETFEDIVARS